MQLLKQHLDVVCVISLVVNDFGFFKKNIDEQVYKKKIKVYQEETMRVLELYPGNVISINAQQRLLDVFKDILVAIQKKI